jgi:hypothetical protein
MAQSWFDETVNEVLIKGPGIWDDQGAQVAPGAYQVSWDMAAGCARLYNEANPYGYYVYTGDLEEGLEKNIVTMNADSRVASRVVSRFLRK